MVMNGIYLVIASACILILAYRFYGAFIAAKVLTLDQYRPTPAMVHNDGHDYVPTNKWVTFGHHFAAIAGAGGVLYAHNLSTLTALPANFGYNMSIMILVFVVLGGMGSFRGSIIAAVLLTMLPEVLRGLADYRMLIYAIVLIIMMLFNWAPKCIEFRQRVAAKLKKNTKKGVQ